MGSLPEKVIPGALLSNALPNLPPAESKLHATIESVTTAKEDSKATKADEAATTSDQGSVNLPEPDQPPPTPEIDGEESDVPKSISPPPISDEMEEMNEGKCKEDQVEKSMNDGVKKPSEPSSITEVSRISEQLKPVEKDNPVKEPEKPPLTDEERIEKQEAKNGMEIKNSEETEKK